MMDVKTSILIKIFLALYATFITSIGTFLFNNTLYFDIIFAMISYTASVSYIFYLKTRGVVELTLVDRKLFMYCLHLNLNF